MPLALLAAASASRATPQAHPQPQKPLPEQTLEATFLMVARPKGIYEALYHTRAIHCTTINIRATITHVVCVHARRRVASRRVQCRTGGGAEQNGPEHQTTQPNGERTQRAPMCTQRRRTSAQLPVGPISGKAVRRRSRRESQQTDGAPLLVWHVACDSTLRGRGNTTPAGGVRLVHTLL